MHKSFQDRFQDATKHGLVGGRQMPQNAAAGDNGLGGRGSSGTSVVVGSGGGGVRD